MGLPGQFTSSAQEAAVLRNRAKEYFTIKRTYQPKKRYRKRVHGFLKKMASPAGRRILRHRRRKGRHDLTPS
jgi:large subunit ribosomal protein L34